jgi:hypothetical protein
MEDHVICNFTSVLDYYTEHYGQINLQIKDNILYNNNIKYNLKIPIMNLSSIISNIEKQKKYIIHIINITYDPSTDSNDVSINYYKTLIIDNCGDIYSTISTFYDYKKLSIYPQKVDLNDKRTEYPIDYSVYPLPNMMIDYIKNINTTFIFKSIDYTKTLYNIISKLKDTSASFYEFKQETIKNQKIIEQKDSLIKNIIDNEINDYKIKHEAHIESLQQIITFVEYENHITTNALYELQTKNNNIEHENNKYKNNICVKITAFFNRLCKSNKLD